MGGWTWLRVHDFSPTPYCHRLRHGEVGCCWSGGTQSAPVAPTQPTTNSSKRFSQSVKRRGVATAQFEALLLDELDVEATAMPEVPEEATDLRMWGMRKGSLASW